MLGTNPSISARMPLLPGCQLVRSMFRVGADLVKVSRRQANRFPHNQFFLISSTCSYAPASGLVCLVLPASKEPMPARPTAGLSPRGRRSKRSGSLYQEGSAAAKRGSVLTFPVIRAPNPRNHSQLWMLPATFTGAGPLVYITLFRYVSVCKCPRTRY